MPSIIYAGEDAAGVGDGPRGRWRGRRGRRGRGGGRAHRWPRARPGSSSGQPPTSALEGLEAALRVARGARVGNRAPAVVEDELAAADPVVGAGAFAGLRLGEACGHRAEDTDFMRGVVHPRYQYPAEPLKSDYSKTQVPVGRALALQLSARAGKWPGETLLTGLDGGQLSPWALERAIRAARSKVPGLPAVFRYHDLRHYLASLLIAHGADVKTVQARLRHGSATTTLNTYGHLWPDKDESTKAIVDSVINARFEGSADSSRTAGGAP